MILFSIWYPEAEKREILYFHSTSPKTPSFRRRRKLLSGATTNSTKKFRLCRFRRTDHALVRSFLAIRFGMTMRWGGEKRKDFSLRSKSLEPHIFQPNQRRSSFFQTPESWSFTIQLQLYLSTILVFNSFVTCFTNFSLSFFASLIVAFRSAGIS